MPPGAPDATDGKAASAPGSPVPTPEPLPSILKDTADLSPSPQPEPAPLPPSISAANPATNVTVTVAPSPGVRGRPVRSGSLPPNMDGTGTGAVPLEAMLRAGAGAGRRSRVSAIGTAPRGRFKSNPITGFKGEGPAGEAVDAGPPAPGVPAAAVPIPIDETAKRSTTDSDPGPDPNNVLADNAEQ
ncbi:hypothetical protein B0H12DRAFT_635508 [Mycena haematopus]|nr:hypothetical protein B0H12DRAFT_635508 [Mycena haematopus]